MSTIYNVATAAEDTLPSIFAQAADGVPHRIICLLNQLLTAGAGQSAQVYHYYEGEQRKTGTDQLCKAGSRTGRHQRGRCLLHFRKCDRRRPRCTY